MHARTPKRRFLAAAAVTASAALVLAGCAESQRGDDTGGGTDGDVDSTFIFAGSSDPKTLDRAFAQDGESFRVSRQIFEGLVGEKVGTADPEPLLASIPGNELGISVEADGTHV